MSTWILWFAISLSAVLLALVLVLLFRIIAKSRADRRLDKPADRRFVPMAPDETMVISREQADEMLNK